MSWLQLGVAGLFGAIWLRTRNGRRSERELWWLDTIASALPLVLLMGLMQQLPPPMRPELFGAVAIAHLVMMRAVIVPSTPQRTALVAITLALPLAIRTYFYYAAAARPELPPPWVFTLVVCAWGSASTVMSSLASYTIYGLRQRVREATKLGQYTLEQKIGEGGMGIVYRASHAMLRRPTAIKLLPPERAGEQNLKRFEREVQLTSLLTHPNTIAIYDYGRTPDGVFYYAMEYLDGIDLEELVKRDGPQAPGCVVQILEQIAGALAEAHGAGLIHRDVKPANVLLCERGGAPGVVKVVDFGLVKQSGNETPTNPALSTVNAIMGTPLYLSPEAIVSPATIDARSDLYALGAVGYFLLTGKPVFEAETVVEVCGHHLHTEPIAPSERLGRSLPSELEALVLACLQKKPEQRPESATELAARLHALPCRNDWTPETASAWWRRVRTAAASRFPEARPKRDSPDRTLAIEWADRVG
jgi:eukaryotic-like serine/threonine-protein kinase